jgi:hypothetical protein
MAITAATMPKAADGKARVERLLMFMPSHITKFAEV